MAAKTLYSASDITIEPLNLSEDLSKFTCGNKELKGIEDKKFEL